MAGKKNAAKPQIDFSFATSGYIPESDEQRLSVADMKAEMTGKLESALDALGSSPVSVKVVVKSEGPQTDKVQKVTVRISAGRTNIVANEHSRSISRAIDKVVPHIARKVRKNKTRKVDRSRKRSAQAKRRLGREYTLELG